MAAKKRKVVYSRRKNNENTKSDHFTKKQNEGSSFAKALKWMVIIAAVIYGTFYFLKDDPQMEKDYMSSVYDQSSNNITEGDVKLDPIEVRKAKILLTETAQFTIEQKKTPQEIIYDEKTSIHLPANFIDKNQVLSVSKATVDEESRIAGSESLFMIDLTLNDGKQPTVPVEVSYQYDELDFESVEFNEDLLEAYRWDEEIGSWVSLPIRVDRNQRTISYMVDHFSISGAFLAVYVTSTIGEKILNDCYVTPEENFKIYYSKDKVDADPDLNNSSWQKAPVGKATHLIGKVPQYILASGNILEQALKTYIGEPYQYENPAITSMGILGTYQNPIKVKIDSWYVQSYGQGESSNENIFGRIHIPTSKAFNIVDCRITLAHELFHSIQAEYYGLRGMLDRDNTWFLEATAEYAAHAYVWPGEAQKMFRGFGNNYLEFPINATGVKSATGSGWAERDYEYMTSSWIWYLAAKGLNIRDLIAYDAKDNWDPRISINRYLYETQKKRMSAYYRAYAHHTIFEKNSPLKKHPLYSADRENSISRNYNALEIGKSEMVTQNFNMPFMYSTQVGVVEIKHHLKGAVPVIISIDKKETVGQAIDVYHLDQEKRHPTTENPIVTFYQEEKEEMITVMDGDLLCFILTNGELEGGLTKISIKDASVLLSIDPPGIENAIANKFYEFKVQAERIPKEVEKVKFEWDFGDHSEYSMGSAMDVGVSFGSAGVRINYTYSKSNQPESFPLKVILKDEKTNMVLASAEAIVQLPLGEATVFITEKQLTGSPGATFDMEALASPEGKYQFVWEVEGVAEAFKQQGKKSGYAPVIKEAGRYGVLVKLYDMNGKFLARDVSTIYVEGNNDVELLVYQVLLENPFDYSEDGVATIKKGFETARKAYVGNDVWATTNLLQSTNKFRWKIDGQFLKTVGNAKILMLRCGGEEHYPIQDRIIGLGHHKIEVEVFNAQNRLVGKDQWEITVEEIPYEPLDMDSGMYPEEDTGRIGG